jgi:hypothetical protein
LGVRQQAQQPSSVHCRLDGEVAQVEVAGGTCAALKISSLGEDLQGRRHQKITREESERLGGQRSGSSFIVVADGSPELGFVLEPGEVLVSEICDRRLFVKRVPIVRVALL